MAKSLLPELLSDMLGLKAPVRVTSQRQDKAWDLNAFGGGWSFAIEVKSGTPAMFPRWWERASTLTKGNQVLLLVVPFMTTAGRKLCAKLGINWLDLAGNADITAPGLRVRIEGRPNRLLQRGRPPSVFERRSSRVGRILLLSPERDWSVRECAHASGLDEGHVSRILSRLVEMELLAREGKRLRVTDPRQLLEAWRDEADFSKHRILRGQVPARSGEELLALVSKRLTAVGLGHAATGLGAAWLYDHFAMFRLATLFLRGWPSASQLEALHFREEPTGANVWLVLPTDDGVFEGVREIENIPCVHPVQVYVDLKDQPERAAEAAEHLKQNPLLLGGERGTR